MKARHVSIATSLLASCLFAVTAAAAPREALTLTNGWKAAYCERLDEQPPAEAWGDYPRREPF